MCDYHAAIYRKAMTTPIVGITRPTDIAPEDWRGSLLASIKYYDMLLRASEKTTPKPIYTQRDHSRFDDHKRYAPAQLEQVMVLRAALSESNDRKDKA
jgi:hypothetical protein